MVSRFGLFLAWLVMAAVPLQGLAAASMLYCGVGAHHAPGEVTAVQQAQLVSDGNAGRLHDSGHGHAAGVQAKEAADTGSKNLPDSAHKCGVCASCCHSLAIGDIPGLLALAPSAQAGLAEPLVLIHAGPSQVPDKPPRP